MSRDFLAPITRWNAPFVPLKCTIVASVAAKTGTIISYVMGAVSQAQEWWLHQPDGEAQLQARLHQVPSASWRHPLTRDSSLPSGAAQPLSFSSSTTGLSCFLRETVGANHQYGRIAPIVSQVLSREVLSPNVYPVALRG